MTNDEKISKLAELAREMADEFGVHFSIRAVRKDDLYFADKYSVTVGDGHGYDADPSKALTEALADHERKIAEKALKAEIEAEFKARAAQKIAA